MASNPKRESEAQRNIRLALAYLAATKPKPYDSKRPIPPFQDEIHSTWNTYNTKLSPYKPMQKHYSSTVHNPSDEGEYDFEAEVNGKGKSKKCPKCGKRKKLLGGSFEKLKALRLVAGNAGTNKQNMRAAIDTQGYTNEFIQAGAYPQGNGRLTRPEQVNILDTTWLIAQYEVNNGLMTQAEAATISPTRHFTQAEVQNFINSLP